MTKLRYITHPNVRIDPNQPVAQWGLNDEGKQKAKAMLAQPWVSSIGRIVSSNETKAIETANFLSAHLGVPVQIRQGIGENDRTAAGFVPPEEFEVLADAFFAKPDESVRGWEQATEAQTRIVTGLSDLLNPIANTEIAVVGHGGVGTLWYCHLTGKPINRSHDQPSQGHYYTVNLASRSVTHPWRPIDKIEP